tara:strand:- start:5559 stop:6680 length:1122 start_codon:yes stop_codon:yes gene_type:complete
MKTIFNLKVYFVAIIATLTLSSCDNEDYLIFTAQEPSEGVEFVNELKDSYKIAAQISNNMLERFVWNTPDFSAPSTVVYVVDGSLNSSFSTIDWSSGETSNNHISIPVGDILLIADNAGVMPGDVFDVHFRVTAYAGSSGGSNSVSTVSAGVSLSVEYLNLGSCDDPTISNWGLVGSAVNGWGGINRGFAATNDIELLQVADGIYQNYATLLNGEMKFRQDGGWTVNLGDNGADGTLEADGANIAVSEGTYLVTLDLNSNSYSLEAVTSVIWGIVGSGVTIQKDDGSGDVAEWGGGSADTKFFPDPCNDGIFLLKGVGLRDGEIKFRQDDGWAVNLGDNGADGTLDVDGANIAVTAGVYDITFDSNNNTYTIE